MPKNSRNSKIVKKINCPCGSIYRADGKSRHVKTNKHKKYSASLAIAERAVEDYLDKYSDVIQEIENAREKKVDEIIELFDKEMNAIEDTDNIEEKKKKINLILAKFASSYPEFKKCFPPVE